MSVSRMVTVVCDVCSMGADASGWTVAEARAVARELGFRTVKGHDVCADCIADGEVPVAAFGLDLEGARR